MSDSQSTADLNAQIEKLEAKPSFCFAAAFSCSLSASYAPTIFETPIRLMKKAAALRGRRKGCSRRVERVLAQPAQQKDASETGDLFTWLCL